MIVAGIDPGLGGAIAFYDTATGDVEIIDMPTLATSRNGKAKREVDAHALADMFWKRHAEHAVLEKVASMPKQGVAGTFSFGDSYGAVRGILAAVGVPMTRISPATWKRAMGVSGGKDGARARSKELLPQAADQWPLVKHDGRAESALLALYGARTLSAPQQQQVSDEAA